MTESEVKDLNDQLKALQEKACEAVDKAFQEERKPEECPVVESYLEKEYEIRRRLGYRAWAKL